ncbi:MAG: replicative DNA helicase [Gemmatimonadaceae bacterium]|nr:replicative DNA helicase [Gemmatimonadaceae bacterium]
MTELGLVPPSDLDAEGAVLSAILLSPEALDRVESILKPEHFYADCNRLIFSAARSLAAQGRPCDMPMVVGFLRDANALQRAGGSPYMAELMGQPSVVRLEETARRIVDKWRLRSLIRQCDEIRAEAYGGVGLVQEFVQDAEARVYSVAQDAERSETLHRANDVMRQCFTETAEARKAGKPTGLSTGFLSLDRRIGGLKPGRVYVGAGRPGMGKTSFLTHVAKSVALSTAPARGVFLASVEMPAKQIGDRLIAQESGLDTRFIENGVLNPNQWRQYTDAVNVIGKWPLLIEEQGGLAIPRLRSSLRRAARTLERDHGTKLGMVGVDYLQLMTDDGGGKFSNENDRITKISSGLLAIAKEFNVPVVLLSQLNRECEKRQDKRPQMSDLRGSGSIEQDAHTVILFFRGDVYREPRDRDRTAEFIVAKCRGGQVGTTKVGYLDHCTKFIDEPDDDPADEYARAAAELGEQFDEQMDAQHWTEN